MDGCRWVARVLARHRDRPRGALRRGLEEFFVDARLQYLFSVARAIRGTENDTIEVGSLASSLLRDDGFVNRMTILACLQGARAMKSTFIAIH